MQRPPYSYDQRHYWSAQLQRLAPQKGEELSMPLVPGEDQVVSAYDVVFLFHGDILAAVGEIIGMDWSQGKPPAANVTVSTLATLRDALRHRGGLVPTARQFVLNHCRQQVVDLVLASVRDRPGKPGVLELLPVTLGDRLLDAYQLPSPGYDLAE